MRSNDFRGPRRTLPVVRWLQVGAVAAGVGVALVAAPGTAAAEEGADTSPTSATEQTTPHSTSRAAEHRAMGSPRRAGAASSSAVGASAPVQDRNAPAAASAVRPRASVAAPAEVSDSVEPATSSVAVDEQLVVPKESRAALQGRSAAAAVTSVPVAAAAPLATSPVAAEAPVATSPAQASVTAQFDPFGQFAAFFGLPGAPPTAAPSIGAFPILTRLTLDDLFTGTGPATVTNPTAVVTGLFNQVLRVDPTAAELQNYLGILSLTGVNGVTAGLYSSTAFRQTQVNNFYLELLNRNATSQELAWGASALMWGTPEPLFAASIAGSRPFYQASGAGGGTAGVSPSTTTYVANLYRSLLGTPVDAAVAMAYIQQLNAGLPIQLAAWQFVTADAFRQAKVQEIYSVLGQTATQAEITSAVQNWFWHGGLAGIATSLMATSRNVSRIETGQVALPDMVAAAQLQEILLAAYTSTEDGFVKTLNRLLNVDENNPCTPSSATCNQALYTLLTTGGADRGLSNSALTVTFLNSNVANLVPTQNEIDLEKSLRFPLQTPEQLETFFAGGVITPFGNPVVTSDGGNYIVDGHHRWSGIYLINPFTEVKSVDIGYVPNPQVGLKEAQIGVVAQLGYLKVSQGGGFNVYTVDRTVFTATVNGWITTGARKDEVLAVFRNNLGIPDTATEAEQLDAINAYLWTNVERMRALNPFVPGATNREVMPQAEPLTPILAFLGSGLLSYSFPTISYLG